jgi:plasmid stability protein
MLAITKIIRDRVRPLAAFGHFLEGEARRGLRNSVLLEQVPRTSVSGRTSRRRR